MENEKLNKESRCSPLTSIDLLDSRTEQERGAETPKERARRAVERAFLHLTNKQILEHALKYVAAEIREAVQLERAACAAIADDVNYQGDWDCSEPEVALEIRARNS